MKKKRIIRIAILIVILLAAATVADLDNDEAVPHGGIDTIYVYMNRRGFIMDSLDFTPFEAKVDLGNKQFWEYFGGIGSDYIPRDESAENEGYTFVRNLADDKIKTFIHEAAQYGFLNWKSKDGAPPPDSLFWRITVVFSDGTRKEIYGFGVYPDTWFEMHDAFKALTSENVLWPIIDVPSPSV